MSDYEPPTAVVAVPASDFSSLRGRRAIIGVPGIGFRGDLRADDAIVRGSRTFVPVLSELDFYRAESDQLEAFAPLVPVERVWIEHVGQTKHERGVVPSSLDCPPTRVPLQIAGHERVLGQRVIQAVPDGHVRDLRAVTDPYHNSSGATCIKVCAEADWYTWATRGSVPASLELDIRLLWLE